MSLMFNSTPNISILQGQLNEFTGRLSLLNNEANNIRSAISDLEVERDNIVTQRINQIDEALISHNDNLASLEREIHHTQGALDSLSESLRYLHEKNGGNSGVDV